MEHIPIGRTIDRSNGIHLLKLSNLQGLGEDNRAQCIR